MGCIHHWFLGETWDSIAYDDMDEPGEVGVADPQPSHGTYFGGFGGFAPGGGSPGSPGGSPAQGSPAEDNTIQKVRGLLPEYGLAHWFNGSDVYVEIDSGISGPGSSFTITLLFRPDNQGMLREQCLVHTSAAYVGLTNDDRVVFGTVFGGLGGSPSEGLVSDPVEAGREYLVVASYNGTQGTLYVRELVATATTDVSGPEAISFGTHSAGEIGRFNDSQYFVGGMQGVSIHNDAFTANDVDELVGASVWIDVTPDVEIAQPVILDQGIHDDSALARIAASGRCTLVMDNSHLNTGGVMGYYSPDHEDCRPGFTDGIPLRVSLPDSGSPDVLRVQFIGSIRIIRPLAGQYRERRTFVLGTDWMDEAARARVEVETEDNVTADDLIRILLNQMRNRPHDIDFAEGSDEIAVAFHNISEEATVLSELQKITMTEYGVTYTDWDGTLVFESRGSRSGGEAVSHSIQDAIEIEQERNTDQKHNRIWVTTHPATAGSDDDVVLYSLNIGATPPDQAVTIPNIAEGELFFPFQDPTDNTEQIGATDVWGGEDPTPGVHYVLNEAPDGSGADITTHASITLEWRVASNGVYLTVENGYGQAIYLTFLEIIGRPIFTYNEVIAKEEDADSIADHGIHELKLDMPYQSDSGVGLSLAQYLLAFYKDVATRIKRCTFYTVESSEHLQACLFGNISDRVHISEVVSGVDADYYIQGRRVEWYHQVADEDGNDQDHMACTWFLAPTDPNSGAGAGGFWRLSEDTLSETTVLGF